jgi:tetratricopeptide (TPR) repeat protein
MWNEQLADLWLRNNQPGRAFFHARRAIRHGTDNQAIYLQSATWAAQYDSLDAAFEILDSAISRFGPLDPYVVNKALLLSYAGEHRRAEALMRSVVEKDNPPIPTMRLNLANILAAQPQSAKKREALDIYREIREPLLGRYPIDSLIQVVNRQL